MTKTVEGFYQDGYIQISKLPQGVSEQTQVLVTFKVLILGESSAVTS